MNKKIAWVSILLFVCATAYAAVIHLDQVEMKRLDVDNVRVDGNTISTTNSNGNLVITPNGSGKVLLSPLSTTNRYLISGTSGAVEESGLTSTEGAQLQNIDSNTISNAQWGYLSAMDQSVATGATPSFTGLSSVGTLNITAQNEIRLQDTSGGEYMGFKAPSTVTTSKTFTLPDGDGTSGQVLKTNGSAVLSWADDVGATGANKYKEVFTSSGTFNVPSTTTLSTVFKVTVIGGGGGGGASGVSSGGGGGGGTCIKWVTGLTPSGTETVTVGAGGAAANAGGTSSFGSHCSATGGSAGGNSPGGNGGTGGVGSSGDINAQGGGGSQGTTYSGVGNYQGGGGSSSLGGGGRNGAGTGGLYGGGGAGSASGAAGIVIVEWIE